MSDEATPHDEGPVGLRRRFRAWRRQRPFWAGIFLAIAGLEILAPAYATLKLGNMVISISTIGGVSSLVIGVLLIVLGISLWVRPEYRVVAAIVAGLLSLVALATSNLGGFMIGTLLGLIGTALALAWGERKPKRKRRRGRKPRGSGPSEASGGTAGGEAAFSTEEFGGVAQPSRTDTRSTGRMAWIGRRRHVGGVAGALLALGMVGGMLTGVPAPADADGPRLPQPPVPAAPAPHLPLPGPLASIGGAPSASNPSAPVGIPTPMARDQPPTKGPSVRAPAVPTIAPSPALAPRAAPPTPTSVVPAPGPPASGPRRAPVSGPPASAAPSSRAGHPPSTAPQPSTTPTPSARPAPSAPSSSAPAPTPSQDPSAPPSSPSQDPSAPPSRPSQAPPPPESATPPPSTPAPPPPAPAPPPPAPAPHVEAGGLPMMPVKPWTLRASKLHLSGARFNGVTDVPTKNGSKPAMWFTVDRIEVTNLVQTADLGNGKTMRIAAAPGSTSTVVDGPTQLYTEELKGNLSLLGLQIPVDFTPALPPPITPPDITFTNVTVKNAGQLGGKLTIPGAHLTLQ